MIRILRTVTYNSREQVSVETVVFKANDVRHLDALIEAHENHGIDQRGDELRSYRQTPSNFDGAGGFASDYVDFKDENGNDCPEYANLGWWTGQWKPHLAGAYATQFEQLKSHMPP